ncbi:hypothetical protein [Candidatus Accumulibacter phosphatis]
MPKRHPEPPERLGKAHEPALRHVGNPRSGSALGATALALASARGVR